MEIPQTLASPEVGGMKPVIIRIMERAKQLLIKQQGCSESEAYARLRQAAMNVDGMAMQI